MPRVRRYLIRLHQPRRLGVVALVNPAARTVLHICLSFSPLNTLVTSIRGIMKLMKDQSLYLSVVRYHNLIST